MGAANSYGQGMQAISAGIQQLKAKREADDAILAKAKSTETFIKAHSELFGGEEAVKQMTATDPREAPAAKYQRLAQVMQDTVIGEKLKGERQQQAAQQQAMAAKQFEMQQAQRKAQEEAAQRAKLQQYLGLVQGGGGQPQPQAQAPADDFPLSGFGGGAGGPPVQRPAPMPQQQQADPMLQQALAYFKATGRVPDSNAASAMIGDTSRQEVAASRADAVAAQNTTRQTIEDAKRKIEQQKFDATQAEPRYHTDPETGIRSVYSGAQWVPLPGQITKDPALLEIDRLEKAGDYTHAEAVALKKKILNHKGEFSPNSGDALANVVKDAMNRGGTSTSTSAPAAAPGGGARRVNTQAEYDALPPGTPYIGPDGLPATKRGQ